MKLLLTPSSTILGKALRLPLRLISSRTVVTVRSGLGNLLQHISLNELNNVSVVQCAISDRIGMASFQAHSNNSMGKLSEGVTRLLMPTVSIDDLLASGIPTPDIIKMDIEGGELRALHGATATLAAGRTRWLIALDDPASSTECRGILESTGHSISNLGSDAEIVARPRTK